MKFAQFVRCRQDLKEVELVFSLRSSQAKFWGIKPPMRIDDVRSSRHDSKGLLTIQIRNQILTFAFGSHISPLELRAFKQIPFPLRVIRDLNVVGIAV